jgi:triacylglycerol esterase/lipase EstA (alpha/beta hydrolase family)
MKVISSIVFFVLWAVVVVSKGQENNPPLNISPKDSTIILIQRLDLFDYTRNRSVPVALYMPDSAAFKQKVILFSPGYDENKRDMYLNYSYLNNFLAQHGYLVVSIQQDLPTDDPLPTKGNLREKRAPFWESGMQNILFVMKELKTRIPTIYDKKYSLIGHSNGGDISMYFITEYPKKTVKAISLDNRRMPLPTIDSLRIYSLRSSDLPADAGVLPPLEQQRKHGMKIITLANTKHNEMCDDTATEEQKKEICDYVLLFLEEKK